MKHLSLFIVLILLTSYITNVLNKEKRETTNLKSSVSTQGKDKKQPSPSNIANEIIVGNTVREVLKQGLNQSVVDKNPDRFHILNNSEHNENYRELKTDTVYYPGKPIVDNSLPGSKNIKKKYYSGKSQPYYGGSKTYIKKLDDPNQVGQMDTPIVLQDLDETKGSTENLENLKAKLDEEKAKVYYPNPEYEDNFKRGVYKNDFTPYYDTTKEDKESTIKEIEDRIAHVENLIIAKGNSQSSASNVDVDYKRVPSQPIIYQNAENALREESNKAIVKNNWYDAKQKIDDLNKGSKKK